MEETEYDNIGKETEEERIQRIVLWAQLSPFEEKLRQVMSSAITSFHYVPVDTRDKMIDKTIQLLKEGYSALIPKDK